MREIIEIYSLAKVEYIVCQLSISFYSFYEASAPRRSICACEGVNRHDRKSIWTSEFLYDEERKVKNVHYYIRVL